MLLSNDQLQGLKNFIRDDLARGANTFDFPDPDSATEPQATIRVKIAPIEYGVEGIRSLVSIRFNIQP